MTDPGTHRRICLCELISLFLVEMSDETFPFLRYIEIIHCFHGFFLPSYSAGRTYISVCPEFSLQFPPPLFSARINSVPIQVEG